MYNGPTGAMLPGATYRCPTMQTQAKTTPANKAKPAPAAQAASTAAQAASTAALLAAAASTPAPQPTKKPPVVYAAGVAAGGAPNAPVVTIAGAPATCTLAATTPINRGVPNAAQYKTPKQWAGAATLALAKPLPTGGPNASGNAFNSAVNALFAAGATQTPASVYAALCGACSGGAQAHMGYIAKNGWVVPGK